MWKGGGQFGYALAMGRLTIFSPSIGAKEDGAWGRMRAVSWGLWTYGLHIVAREAHDSVSLHICERGRPGFRKPSWS